MPKRQKSNRLFAILAIPTDIQRDISLSKLIGGDCVEYIEKRYIASGGYGPQIEQTFYSKNFNYIRKWKTESGCINYKNMLDKSTRSFNDGQYEGFTMKYEWSKATYEVVDITDYWNQHIEREILDETQRHINEVAKLRRMKLQ